MAALFGVLVFIIALTSRAQPAGGSSGAITVSEQELRELIRAEVDRRLSARATKKKKSKRGPAGPPGPAGPQGPAGSPGSQGAPGAAPACQGNGSGDAMVVAGAVCIDKYEVSVWSSPTGGTRYGETMDDYPCDDEGQDCKAGTAGEIYARSVPGVTPSRYITYFQAQAALANVGKRLPTNAEWQQAVAGTPDPGGDNGTTDCKTAGASAPVNTGSRSACVSNFGAFDIVGNLWEWVGDWVPHSTACLNWDAVGTFSSDDQMCLAGADATNDADDGPGALVRGSFFSGGSNAGPFAVFGIAQPSHSDGSIGFRGAR